MKKILHFLFLPVMVMAIVAGCGDKDEDAGGGRKPTDPYLTISPERSSIKFKADQSIEEKESFTVDTNRPWSVTVTPENGWCFVEKLTKGFIVKAKTNTSLDASPEATITVSAGDKVEPIIIKANQFGATPTISVSPNTDPIMFSSAATESFVYTVSTNLTSWEVKAVDESWCKITNKTDTGFTITAVANENESTLKTDVEITGDDVDDITISVTILGKGVSIFDGSAAAADAYKSGTGALENPFIIETAAQLQKLVKDNDTEGKYYQLASNFHVTASSWTPIGGADGFKGNFDGNGKIISGDLKSSVNISGFFGRVIGGTIDNLEVTAALTNSYKGELSIETGSIAGQIAEASTISNCITRGAVRGGESSVLLLATPLNNATGGVTGTVKDTASKIISVENYGRIVGGTSSGMSSSVYVGGIAGNCKGSVEKSKNHGNVAGNSVSGFMECEHYVGGIVGIGATSDEAIISECINNGKVNGGNSNGSGSSQTNAGGIGASVGYAIGCTNTGEVIGGPTPNTGKSRVGGIAAVCTGRIHTSSNSGNITSGTTTGDNPDGRIITGGIAGYVEGMVFSCCSNSGKIDGAAATSNNQIGDGSITTCTEH